MTSAQLQNPDKTFAETLHETADLIQGETITLRQLLELIGEQGLLLFCMFLTLPFLLPVSIPGVSTAFGIVIVLIGIGVALNRVPWLPRPLMNRHFPCNQLIPLLKKGAHWFERIDRLIRPRVLILTHGPTINRLNGFILVFGALLLMVPLGLIPLSNTLPALAILFLAAGMLQRDGYFILAGYGMVAATVVYFGGLALMTVMAGHSLHELLSFIIVLPL